MKPSIFSIALLTLIMFVVTNTSSVAQENSSSDEGVVLFVEFQFDENDFPAALELLTEMQMQVLENEEGCIAYDLLLSDEQPNMIFIYESYENKKAVDLHNKTPYYKNIVTVELPKYIKKSKVTTLKPLNTGIEESEDFIEEF